MNPHNIPQNKDIAQYSLTLVKLELLELLADMAGSHTTVANISDDLRNRIQMIDNMLEGADYEEAANLDHMTENQFNGNI